MVTRALRDLRVAVMSVIANPNLRRLELGWIGSDAGEFMTLVVFSVFAFDHGGAGAVGVMALVRTLPTAIGAPFVAGLADRHPRVRVMIGADLSRALLLVLAAVLIATSAPVAFVFAIAGIIEVVSAAFRPAQAAIMPTLADTPEELTAANTMTSAIRSVGALAGPAAGGLILAATSTPVALGACAGAYAWSLFNVSRIRSPGSPSPEQEPGEESELGGVGREALAGFRAIASDRSIRLIIGLFGVQTMAWGAIQVFVVVLALHTLDLGSSGPGLLFAALGVGGLAGAALMFALVARGRLGSCFGIGVALWGAPLVLIALWPNTVVVLVVLLAVGIGNSMADVGGDTLLQRVAPEHVLARIFGVLESVLVAGIGIGAILAPGLIDLLGIRGALVGVGAAVSLVVAVSWVNLRALDRRYGPEAAGVTVPIEHPF